MKPAAGKQGFTSELLARSTHAGLDAHATDWPQLSFGIEHDREQSNACERLDVQDEQGVTNLLG